MGLPNLQQASMPKGGASMSAHRSTRSPSPNFQGIMVELYLLAILCFKAFSKICAISLALPERSASSQRASKFIAQKIILGLGSSTSIGIMTFTP